MPDLVNFQKEMRRGAVRGAGEDEVSRSKGKGKEKEQEKEKDASASRGKEREASNSTGKSKEAPAAQGSKAKSRKRPSNDTDEDNAGSSQEDRSHKKHKTGASNGKDAAESDKEAVPQKDNRKTGRPAAGHKRQDSKRRISDVRGQKDPDDDESPSSATPSLSRSIRFMTTGVQLSDDVLKALTKLGAKTASKPSECTHLIVKRLGRTEKLLSAIAVAPYVVTEKWATASAAAKQYLPPEKYPLIDPENEKRYGFKLQESLDRAKANQGQLYADMVFYVTPKVPIDKKLLKNVVAAHGGQVRTQTPTVRALGGKENHYVISCEDDASIWRPLAQTGHPIYTQELLLTGALTQELDLDNPAHRVPDM
ncbi:hypothetical protein EWM64_g4901 [Hericium alpestre]|uniref:BRCT domain-containing protein n=1 Tax=Hericium alpestre TaxID=135208 RepID=A0A4Y9ZW59_9AGAM|nr:hypothetical protein EWM64_g4901 [Hericium alpestre]